MAGIGRRAGRMLGRVAKKGAGLSKSDAEGSKGRLDGPLMGKVNVEKDRQAVGKVTKKARQALLGRGRRSKSAE